MPLILGLNIGGTKARAVLIDTDAKVLKFSEGESFYLPLVPQEKASELLKKLITKLGERFDIVGVSSTGIIEELKDFFEIFFRTFFAEYGVEENKVIVFENIFAAHISALLFNDGVVYIAGTGSNTLGILGNKIVRVGGWGHILGDEGSAFSIGRKGLSAALRFYDGREKETKLLEEALKFFKAKSAEMILIPIYSNPNPKPIIAAFAPIVTSLARNGDKVAQRIIEEEANEIARAIHTAIRRLGNASLKIAIVGGL